MSDLPDGTVTFLFTDIQGSTTIAQQYPGDMPALLARHHDILHGAIRAHGGYVFQIVGDSFYVAFHHAKDALLAAIDAQRQLQAEPWSPAPLKVRMGIHTGPAQLEGEGDKAQYSGYSTLALTQRIMAAGHGGQILISEPTGESTRNELAPPVQFIDMGERRLKGVLQPEHLFQVSVPDLPFEFPPLKTEELFQHNLPAQLTSFIGREKEMQEVKSLLAANRIVTLIGSGGAGKTRLSLQVGMDCLGQFSNGVWIAELASISDETLIPQTLLSIFNLREDSHRDALDVFIDHVREKSILLLLDNCEHLIRTCAEICQKLLQTCPKLKILASSRETLGIAGEIAYRVPSMESPDPENLPPLDQLEKVDSIRLFIERARTAKADFALTQENASFLCQICYRLDGIPLAIELAAVRVKVLTPQQIAERLDDRFRLLTGGSRTALPRQQTLRAMIDWSYSLLSEEEKTLFRRLAVFVGGWTLEAAQSVCGEEGHEMDIIDLLTHLVDKSLVAIEETGIGLRYHRLETIRQYSREKFFETNEVEAVRDRHLDFMLGFAEQADENLKGRDQVLWQKRMLAEQDNLRAALDWGLSRKPYSALRIVGAANLFWTAAAYSAEGFRWTQKALDRIKDSPFSPGTTAEQRQVARAKALRGLTRLYLSLGENAKAKRSAEESVAIYRRSKDLRGLAFALVILAYPLEFLGEREQAETILQESYSMASAENDVYVMCRALNLLARVVIRLRGDLDLAERYIQESLRHAEQAGLRSQEAQAHEVSATIALHRNDYEEARRRFRQSIDIYQEIEAKFNVILEKTNLAHMERKLGNYTEALEYYRETLLAFRDIGQTGAVAHQLECFGFVALAQKQHERAIHLFAAASLLRERNHMPMMPDEQTYFDNQLEILHQAMESAAFASAWSKGNSMTMDEAIQLALRDGAVI